VALQKSLHAVAPTSRWLAVGHLCGEEEGLERRSGRWSGARWFCFLEGNEGSSGREDEFVRDALPVLAC
jgi:hypothetical protein